MEKWLQTAAAIVILGLFSFFIVSYPHSQKHQELPTIKVAYDQEVASSILLLDIAHEQGYFDKYQVKSEEVKSGNRITTALVAGDVDVIMGTPISTVSDYLNDFDIVTIASVYSNLPDMNFVTRTTDTTKKIRIGLAKKGGQSQITADIVTKNLGWNEKDVEYVIAGDISSRWAFMERNEIDATFAYTGKGLDEIKNRYDAKILNQSQIYGDDKYTWSLYSTSKVVAEKKEALRSFVWAIQDARDYALQNKEAVKKILIEKYEFSDSAAEQLYREIISVSRLSMQPNKYPVSDRLKDTIIRLNEPKNPTRDLTKFYDDSFVKKGIFDLN